MNEGKENYKTRNILMCAGVVFSILATVLFVSFGGGTPAQASATTEKKVAEFNETLPTASVGELAESKMDAIEIEQARRANGSSFGLLDGSTEQSNGIDIQSQLEQAEDAVHARTEQLEQESREANERIEQSRKEVETMRRKMASSTSTSPAPVQSHQSQRQQINLSQKRAENQKLAYHRLQQQYGKELYPDLEADAEKTPAQQKTKTVETPSVSAQPKKKKGFNTLGAKSGTLGHDIRAVVHGTHKNLTKNSQVKLRLLDPMTINGVTIPRNSFVYGKVSFSEGRVQINIDNVNYQDNVLPFRGAIYDQDGSKGIYVPDNAISDASKEASSSSVSGLNTRTSSRSSNILRQNGVSLVNNATDALKNAVSKKAGENKVSISANYRVTIRERKD